MRRTRLFDFQDSLRQLGVVKPMQGRDQSNSDGQVLTGLPLKPLNSPRRASSAFSYWFSLCSLRFVMAALESTRFVRFALPPSNTPFCNPSTPWPAKTSRAIHSLTSSQRARGPAAPLPRSGCQVEAGRNTAATAEGRKHALGVSDDESDDDLPSLEKLSRTALRPKISTEASKTESTVQRLEQPALDGAGLQVDQTQPGLGGHQGDSRDQPVILDDDDSDKASARDEAEGASGDVNTVRTERDASPRNTSATSELASGPTKSIGASGPWYDVEGGCYIEEPAPGLGPCEQQRVPSAPAQAQPKTLPRSSTPLQNQTNQQGVGSITRSTSVESAVHSLPKPSDSGDDGWTDDSMAELEKELELALSEQGNSPSASAPTPSRPRSVEAPQDEIQSRERTETTGSRPEELQDASPHGTAQGLEEWEQRETEVAAEGGGVSMQEQKGLAAQKEELGQPPMGDQQDLVEVVDADDSEGKEATEALPATQPEIPAIDEHRFRLRGIRTQPLAGGQTETTQYRVVWGKHPNRLDSWVDEDDMQMSMLRPPCKQSSQDLVPPVERDVMRVHRMRYNRCSKGKKTFEYLVDESRTWITEDQLRISLSPMLVAELKASSPHPFSQAQSEVHLRHSATPISDEHRHASRASRGCSSPADPALGGEPAEWKRGHQDMHPEISSETHHSVNTDGNHNTCDTGDEDPRPAKRRKPRSAPAVTSPSTTSLEIDDAQPQADFGCPSTLVDDEHHYTPQTSRSPPASVESAPIAEYQEWPFQGFLKRTRIGNETTYNLEFQLPHVPEHLHLPVLSEALGMRSNKDTSAEAATPHDAGAHSKMYPTAVRPRIKRLRWTPEEDVTIVKMREDDGCSWEEIHAALPHRTPGAIQVQYSTKLKK
ncbi:uncharacterized protein PAC_15135 [Phialocephala subalpina]|uniref:Uncharacterized protein n=1 Tax=Phialocephala subalpina TaxID=576137 RepID=A0A1L7XJL0_9HELO|nr:uncharacterized protein PAC_15135 [Phialocephala subalpina]